MTGEAASAPAAQRGRRQQRVLDTRQRIVGSARALFSEEGFHGVGLEEVAVHAGVGRKTIYYQFGSKLGLLEALVGDLSERALVGEFVHGALTDADVARGVRRFVSGSCTLWESEAGVCRALLALSASDADVRLVVDRVTAARLEDLRRLTNRARRLGRLQRGWSPARAAEALWVLTAFESYDFMRRAGASAQGATNLLCDLALSVLNPGKDPT